MKKKSGIKPAHSIHKKGANRNELAKFQKRPARKANFSQSRDIREDRGNRQVKFIDQFSRRSPKTS